MSVLFAALEKSRSAHGAASGGRAAPGGADRRPGVRAVGRQPGQGGDRGAAIAGADAPAPPLGDFRPTPLRRRRRRRRLGAVVLLLLSGGALYGAYVYVETTREPGTPSLPERLAAWVKDPEKIEQAARQAGSAVDDLGTAVTQDYDRLVGPYVELQQAVRAGQAPAAEPAPPAAAAPAVPDAAATAEDFDPSIDPTGAPATASPDGGSPSRPVASAAAETVAAETVARAPTGVTAIGEATVLPAAQAPAAPISAPAPTSLLGDTAAPAEPAAPVAASPSAAPAAPVAAPAGEADLPGADRQATIVVDAGAPGPSADIVEKFQAAGTALRVGRADQAAELYLQILDTAPADADALLGLATALQAIGIAGEARKVYEELLAIEPGNRLALTNLMVLMAASRPAEALTALETLRERYPRFAPIRAQIAVLHAEAGRLDQAIAEMDRAVGLSGGDLSLLYNLAVLHDRAGDAARAASLYRRVLEREQAAPGATGLPIDDIRRRLAYLNG